MSVPGTQRGGWQQAKRFKRGDPNYGAGFRTSDAEEEGWHSCKRGDVEARE